MKVPECDNEMVKSGRGGVPVPDRLIVCGLPGALSVIDSVPLRDPTAVGVKVTLMVQCALTATELPQLLVWAKSAVVPKLEIERAALPVFVKVSGRELLVVPCIWFPKLSVVADKLAAGAVPVPVRLTVCGLPAALSVTVRLALREPTAVGVKVTLIVQCAPAAKEGPQSVVLVKSSASVPVMSMLEIVNPVGAPLVRVTAFAVEAMLTGVLSKFRVAGDNDTGEN